LILDHFDSFSYNLFQAVAGEGHAVEVVRCDQITVEQIAAQQPEMVVLSPGPRGPRDTGVTLSYLESEFAETCPTLGICLGFQAMAIRWGGDVEFAPEVVHGKTLAMHWEEHPVFKGCEQPLKVARYHSLCVSSPSLPADCRVISKQDEMAFVVEDLKRPWMGFQFHPESFLTDDGPGLLSKTRHYLMSRDR
jgi:anthranilate synthase/aminodeoxychorismate synthase-like glutamine amidotransferase